jgi:aromatic-L-amino-acid/L-tryptophan decarboxylase
LEIIGLRDQIKALEVASQQLEPSPSDRDHLVQQITSYAHQFLDDLPNMKAHTPMPKSQVLRDALKITNQPVPIDDVLQTLSNHVDTGSINTTSGRFLGYIPGGGLYHAALGDYIAAVTNRYAGVYYAGPGAVALEDSILQWIANVLDYPASFSGNLAAGGSIAALTAIITARDACQITGDTIQKTVIYLTEHTHHSIDKSLHIVGLGECIKRTIPVDDCYRMRADALDKAIKQDRIEGLNPWLVLASSGTTNTGAVDPLGAIADIVANHNLWLHVDGSYGGLFRLCPEVYDILEDINRADSLVVNPHKTMFLPYGLSAVLIRDRQKHYATFNASADYMQDLINEDTLLSPADLSPELTKHFRGMRMWLPLKLLGVEPFRAAMSEKIQLTRYFHETMQSVHGFEVGTYPDLSVATYRYVPQRGDANEFNQRLLQSILDEGRISISSTLLDGNFVLRAAIMSFRTHLEQIDEAIDILTYHANQLQDA